MIDYICKYTPLELLAGFSVEGRLCNLASENFNEADKLIHRNVCSFSRAVLENRLYNSKNALVLTDCCDSIRRIYDILIKEGQKIFLLNLPHKDERCSIILFKNQLIKLINEISVFLNKSFDIKKFSEACYLNRIDIHGRYISLMGARVSDELLEFIEKASPLPVKNNTCTGIRRIGKVPDIDNLEEIMIWYAGELLSQPHCMRMMDISSRRLLLNDPNITGIIYNTINFCDFYGFEYAEIKEILRVPIIKIETDYTLQSSAQLKNRLEAFFETLRISAPKDKEPSIKRGNSNEFYTAGIDSGSTSTNAVIIDSNKNVISFSVIPTGVNVTESANRAFENVLQKAGLSKEQISHIVATGYGRTNTGLGKKDVTEITCHAKGAFFLNPNVRTVIDIGGQDSKVIRIDSKGSVKDFAMNDKCAAGTGRFLDMMAQSLELTIEEISKCGLEWSEEINISSMCSVFAQSEVVSLIAAGKKIEDIVHGIYISVAAKVISLSGRTGMDKEFMMTGGVAKNIGVVKAIEEKLGRNVHVEKEPEICGALGAALIAWEEWNSKL